jgi:hypothetical protein
MLVQGRTNPSHQVNMAHRKFVTAPCIWTIILFGLCCYGTSTDALEGTMEAKKREVPLDGWMDDLTFILRKTHMLGI